jgi:hypothetical protein
MIDWTSVDWGKAGTNVHYSEDGSWWDDRDDRTE